ncbi:hypothetical protein [Sphingobium sp. KCTC 72723]|uniref:hypothetical protein n=1 Tax=Sphingobium sp. KCTC 72723 TaxID=2733867 RepID=UPI00165E33B8|nr:hypothetical protein [Sphingobium sp. KCTC 72723]
MKAKTKKAVKSVLGFVGNTAKGLVKNPVVQTVVAKVVANKVKSAGAAAVLVALFEVASGLL